jgi:hypothetical protein
MVKNLTLFCLGILLSINITAQQDYFNCTEAQDNALCDLEAINGYSFSNPPPGSGDVPPDALCGGGAFHNPGWFSFVAGSTEIVLTVNPLPMSCDTVNGNTGVQVALWQGCPGGGGECVGGDDDCNDEPITLEAEDLIVGEIYNLVIDGCSGSVCTVQVFIDNADAFELPDLDDVDLADPDYAGGRGGGCESSLPEDNFCEGLEVLFQIDDEFYETLGAEYIWTIDGPDAGGVEWNFGSYSGTGSPAVIGDLGGELGANGINMVFPSNGTYTICIDNVVTECDANAGGPLCTEVTIITPGEQQFGEYDICALDLIAGWDPTDFDIEDENGNPWIAGPITYDMVESAPDGIVEVMTQDDCGCDFTQIIDINIRGSLDREEVNLFIWECMLPYTWYEEEFFDLEDLPEGDDFLLDEGSAEQDLEGTFCDSLITLTITPLTAIDTVLVGDCTPEGTEFTFQFIGLDPLGNEVEVQGAEFEWIDATTGMTVANTQTALLETGSYLVNLESFIDDLNYMEDELAGIEELAPCDMMFGPYDLVGGASTSPDINPYDQVYCGDELDLLTFSIDTVPDTDYNWIIPPSYNILFNEEDSLAVSIDSYIPTDTLFITASNACGTSDSIPLPISVVAGPEAAVTGPAVLCDGEEYLTGYDGDASLIQSYLWDVPGGNITTGSSTTQNIGITYPAPGSYSYSLTVTDLDGCTDSEQFDITINEVIPNPQVECGGDPSQIIFSWQDVPGAIDYDIQEISLPPGATGEQIGNTYVITNINGGDMATITVASVSADGCVEEVMETTCEAPGCDFSGIVNNNFEDFAICLGDTVNMPIQFDITLPMGYTGTYSGNGVSDTGLFDPESPELVFGINNLNFDYIDATGCSGTILAVVTVNQLPNATFTPTQTNFCVGEEIVLSGAAAQGQYNYGPGAIGDFSGLSYSTPGVKTIEVTVIDPNSGCRDDFEIDVTVQDTLPAPLISCIAGTSQVEFDWDDHPLANIWEVSVSVNGAPPTVTTQNNSEFIQDNLMEGDEVVITVSADASNGCNSVTSSETCTARPCIVPMIDLQADQEVFCSNEQLTPVIITPIVDGFAPAAGTFQFIGNGVSVDMNGVASFDPAAVNPGVTRITFRYTNPVDGCVTSAVLDFELIDVPVPDFDLAATDICVDDVVILTAEAVPAGVTNRLINPAGGNSNILSANEYELSWDLPGSYDVNMTYEVAACPDISSEATVNVRDTIRTPNVSCTDVDTDFILFGWQDQTAVTEYEVYIDNMLVATQANSDYLLENLDPGQQVEIRVVAIDADCGNKEAVELCAAQECIPPTWDINVPDQLCYEAGSGAIALDVTAMSNAMVAGELSWSNPEVDADGNFTPADVSQDYTLTASYTEKNCISDTTINIRVNVIPEAQLDLLSNDVICAGESVTVQSLYQPTAAEIPIWNFDGGSETGVAYGPYEVQFDTPGTYTISLEVDNAGCVSPMEMITITVEEELEAPVVECNSSDINEINLSWDAVDCASEYRVLVVGLVDEIVTDPEYTITGLVENQEVEVVVEAISECACPNVLSQTFTCSSKACIAPDWNINVPTSVCYRPGDPAIALDVTAVSNEPSGSGTLSWPDAEVDANGNFTPGNNSQSYSLTVVYTEGECSFEETIDIEVNIIPEAQLELVGDAVICEGSTVTVRSNYVPEAAETANWDFASGIETGAGFGPYEVRFDTPGTFDISLSVDNNGCVSGVETVQVTVEANLEAPVIDCSSDDINAIDLTWNAVDCASAYNIFVNGIQDGTTNNTNYTITGLNENQEVQVMIEAISECACDNVMSAEVACSSKPCDQTTWSFNTPSLTEVCLDASAQQFTITATPDNLPGNGTGSWTGAAISDPSGTVDPSLVAAGTYDFVYNYEEGGCSYSSPVLQISFVEAPEVDLMAMDPPCPDDLTGTITAAAFGGEPGYMYALDGGSFQSTSEFTEVSIGAHTVEVMDANGCVNMASIDIFPPITPTAEISGPATVISENDATYEVIVDGIDEIQNITWYADGMIVCQGINCLSYTQPTASLDFNLEVEVEYNDGCIIRSEIFPVDVKEIQAYYIPNIVAFGGAPGDNSRWNIFIKGNETFPRSIRVYTRWGNLIYEENYNVTGPIDQLELWNGQSGDNLVETGVYVYSLEIEIEGRLETVVGDVTILR